MMIIPREGDVVRFYTQLSEEDAQEVINVKGRVDLTKWSPEKLLEVCHRRISKLSRLYLCMLVDCKEATFSLRNQFSEGKA